MLAVLWQAEELGHSFDRVRSDEHLASVFLHDVDNEKKDGHLASVLLHRVDNKQVRVNAWPLIMWLE